jgi:hypothetical protein
VTSTDDLCEWVEQQPAWQQDLARRLLLRSQLDGDGYDEALAVVLAAHHALDPDERAPNPQGVVLEDFPVAAQAGDTPRLISFGRVRGVGALSGADELRFAPSGITVVFGANAAGKSTFVGALKVICRAVDRHNVLRGNVFAEDPEEQVASLETVTGAAEPVARRVDLRDPQEPQMSSISVFDSGCAELYIDSENAIAFVPSALLLLARLHPTQNRMRVNIEARLARARGRMPQFTDIAQGTDARRRMDYLSPSTDLDELREAVTLTEAESRRFDVLRAATAAADANETEQNANAASREADLATTLVAALGALTEALSEQRAKRLAALAVEADQAKAAVETATAQFAGLPIQGVGGEAWQRMWEAARNFAAAAPAPSAFPPIASSPCPLCLQPLSSAAADNLGHLEAHVHSTLSEQSQAADLALTQALGELDERKVAQCRGGFLAALREGDSELADSIESFLQSAAARMTTMLSAPKSAEAVPPVVSNPRQQLSEWAAGRTQRAVILRASAQPEEAAQLRAELSELEARNNVASRMEEVVAAVAERARIAGLEAAFSDLNTNRVSRCQRELAESAVTRALEAKLIEEMGALGCGYVRAELRARGAGGETIIGLQLVGANGAPAVSEVL